MVGGIIRLISQDGLKIHITGTGLHHSWLLRAGVDRWDIEEGLVRPGSNHVLLETYLFSRWNSHFDIVDSILDCNIRHNSGW